MPVIFAAKSKSLQEWGSDIGQSKNLYAVGLSEGPAADAVAAWNEGAYAGQTDWTVLAHRETEVEDEAAVVDKLAERVNRLDPNYFPRIKGARGVFKLNMDRVQAHFIMKHAAETGAAKVKKLKPAEIGNYLIDASLS